MDLELTDDQEALRAGIRRLCSGRFTMDAVRAGFDRARWDELAAAGVFSLRADGLGLADAAVIFEDLGAALVAGPLVATHLASGLVDGAVVGALDETDSPLLVEHLDVLDALLVVGVDSVRVLDAAEVRAGATEIGRPLDPLTPLWAVEVVGEGRQVGGAEEAHALRIDGAVLTAALLVGIATAAREQSVAYAGQRKQFDRPIGSFQAIKHLLADMLTREEVARAAVYAAAVTVDDPTVGDPARAASVAKIVAVDAAVANAKGAVQVHGGMGFTWEVDAHLLLKRARVLETHFGSVDDHADAMAARL